MPPSKKAKNTKKKCQGVWRQYDEQMILWSPFWSDGRPEAREANCAVIGLSEDKNAGGWADSGCTVAHPYICERDQ